MTKIHWNARNYKVERSGDIDKNGIETYTAATNLGPEPGSILGENLRTLVVSTVKAKKDDNTDIFTEQYGFSEGSRKGENYGTFYALANYEQDKSDGFLTTLKAVEGQVSGKGAFKYLNNAKVIIEYKLDGRRTMHFFGMNSPLDPEEGQGGDHQNMLM